MARLVRLFEEPAIGRDEGEVSTIAQPEVIHARRGAVEQAKAHDIGRDVEVRAERAVHEQLVADRADEPARARRELAIIREAHILDDDRDVVDAVVARERERRFDRVVEDEQAGETHRDVFLGFAMRMRVVPERRGRLVDRPCR